MLVDLDFDIGTVVTAAPSVVVVAAVDAAVVVVAEGC
jgi:hypothetical protein